MRVVTVSRVVDDVVLVARPVMVMAMAAAATGDATFSPVDISPSCGMWHLLPLGRTARAICCLDRS
jgi:hypothetical protein